MKAISIKQPWASLIAAGVKTLEIRAWPTEHRGPLLIVSSRRPVIEGHRHGEALCVVNVVGCRRMTREDPPFACIREFYFNHYSWILRDVRLIAPFSVTGQLRLFDIDDQLIRDPEPVAMLPTSELRNQRNKRRPVRLAEPTLPLKWDQNC